MSSPKLENLLGTNLLWFGRVLNKRFEALLAQDGRALTSAQARILLRLHHFGPLPQKELAESTEVEPPTLARTVSLMERQGLVRRRRNKEDRRQVVVDLSATGRRRLPHLFELLLEAESWLTDGVSRKDVQRLVRDLSTVRDRLCANTSCGAVGRTRSNGTSGEKR
jgi:DNA-binding MarR family transcriptional regulator